MNPPDKPLLIYDGDCGFCRFWVGRWQARSGGQIDFVPAQSCAAEFPGICAEEFARAVQWVGADGVRASGAAAVCEALAPAGRIGRMLRFAYRHIPGFATVTEACYRIVAANRTRLSRVLTAFQGPLDDVPRRRGGAGKGAGVALGIGALLIALFLIRRRCRQEGGREADSAEPPRKHGELS